MKLVIAIIQPAKLEAVKQALTDKEIYRLTVSDAQGYGQQKGKTEIFRGHEFTVNLLRKVKLEIAVNDNYLEPCLEAIESAAKTGEIGDGKVFVLPLEETVRIRTGERGDKAI